MVVLLVTGGYDHTIRFWDASSGVCYRTLQHPEKQVNCLQIRPDKQYIAAGGNPQIKIYDVNSRSADPVVTYDGHTGNVTCLGFQRDGRWMWSGGEDGLIKIWDLRAPTAQREYKNRAGVTSISLHPNQGELMSGDQQGTIRVWDLLANKCSNELSPEVDAPVSSVAIASDASICVAANYNGSVFFWNPRSGDDYVPIRKLNAHKAYVTAARLSPDLRYLATASSDRSVKLWNLRGGGCSLSRTLAGHSRWVWDAVFSADSTYLVTASSDITAKLWEVASGDIVKTYSGHVKALTAVALNDAPPVAPPTPVSTPQAAVGSSGSSGSNSSSASSSSRSAKAGGGGGGGDDARPTDKAATGEDHAGGDEGGTASNAVAGDGTETQMNVKATVKVPPR